MRPRPENVAKGQVGDADRLLEIAMEKSKTVIGKPDKDGINWEWVTFWLSVRFQHEAECETGDWRTEAK